MRQTFSKLCKHLFKCNKHILKCMNIFFKCNMHLIEWYETVFELHRLFFYVKYFETFF